MLGRSTAHRLLEDGYHCVLVGRDEQALRRTVELAKGGSDRAALCVGDIRSSHDRKRICSVAAADGRLFGVVNNAAITRLKPLLAASVQDWRDVVETNLEASFFLAQEALGYMREAGGGRIVNVGSIYGVTALNNKLFDGLLPIETEGDRGPVRETAYSVSKAGLVQLTKDLAVAVAPWGVTVNIVSPGHVQAPVYDDGSGRYVPHRTNLAGPDPVTAKYRQGKTDAEVRAKLAEQYPLGRLGKVGDVTAAIRFLLSEEAAYITGANLPVDGGFTAW
ncbi:3-oxoacyl-[acyl-carrier protein] reductase [Amycolatopsis sacchari]|uniref:3-oxoacyl-[acyl-carrier protein] reductase n=2 Tax=Amycolatopsis TaxID=1813 RepID=A0A1I3PBF6_9PSEU|nr:3-oxoacyl-[acyl-carrier protein] reductase [Amycolatopsis sacchari]